MVFFKKKKIEIQKPFCQLYLGKVKIFWQYPEKEKINATMAAKTLIECLH